jgi:hypothetical protein
MRMANKQILELYTKKKRKISIYLQTKEVARRLLKILNGHKGYYNAVNKSDLIYKIWNIKSEEMTELQYFFAIELIKKGMHYLRKQTHCQPVSLSIDGEFQYFIPTNKIEANMYEKNMRKNIEGIKKGIQMIHKSVKEKWYNEVWYLEGE